MWHHNKDDYNDIVVDKYRCTKWDKNIVSQGQKFNIECQSN